MARTISTPARLSPSFGLRWPLVALTYCGLQLGWAGIAGPVWLSAVPFVGALLGAWLAGHTGSNRVTRAALGAGLGGALGLLLTNTGWHFLWPRALLDSGWNWGIAEGIRAHLAAFGSAFALSSLHVAVVCCVVRELPALTEQTLARRAVVVSLAVGWLLAWALLVQNLWTSDASEFRRVPLLAWYPGELAYRGYLAGLFAVAMFLLYWTIARRRERRWQAINPRPIRGELEWDRDQYRPTIHLPSPK